MGKYVTLVLILFFVGVVVVGVALWQGLSSFVFAWILNFMLMVLVLYLTQTFKPRLASSYYHSKKWESTGKFYRSLGVQAFRKLLVWIGWEKLNKASNPVKKNLEALKHLEYGTRQSEFGHLIIFFTVLALTVFVGWQYGVQQTLWLLILNVVLNAYPILVQRYNRPRFQQAIRKLQDRTPLSGNTDQAI